MKTLYVILISVLLTLTLTLSTVFTVSAVVKQTPEEITTIEKSDNYAYLYGSYLVAGVQLSEAGAKALQSQVGDIQQWVETTVYKRADDAINESLVKIIYDTEYKYLTKEQIDDIGADMLNDGIFLISYDQLPNEYKERLIIEADL